MKSAWAVLIASFQLSAAPFCVVTGFGRQCWYYDAVECQKAATQNRGLCVPNEEPVSNPGTLYSPVAPVDNSAKEFGESMRELGETLYQIGEADRQEAHRQHSRELAQEQLEMERMRFMTELQEKAIRFDKEFPGEPNPYRNQLRHMLNPKPIAPARAPASTLTENEKAGIMVGATLAGMLLAILVIASL